MAVRVGPEDAEHFFIRSQRLLTQVDKNALAYPVCSTISSHFVLLYFTTVYFERFKWF